MLFKRVLIFLAGASALTTQPRDSVVSVQARSTRDVCDGGRIYVGWFDKATNALPQCKCPKGQTWDESKKSCIYPPLPKPQANPGHDIMCAKNPAQYCKYDDLCHANGDNMVLVVPKTISEADLKRTIQKECNKPRCPSGQVWSEEFRKCKYPSLPRDDADKCRRRGGKPICAKTPKDHCDYDEREDDCEDDGGNCLKCLDLGLGDSVEKILDGVYATIGDALKALGLDCVLGGVGCILNDKVWDKLGGIGGLGDVICSVLGGLLGGC